MGTFCDTKLNTFKAVILSNDCLSCMFNLVRHPQCNTQFIACLLCNVDKASGFGSTPISISNKI